MKKIASLTSAQRARMAPYAQKWIDECLRSGTTEQDWQRTEAGIRASYRAADLAEPKIIVRTTSPLACVMAGPIAAQILGGGAVHGAVDDAVHGAVSDAVDDAVRGAVDGAVHGAVDVAVSDAVHGAVHVAVHGAVDDAVHGAVVGAVDDAVHGAVHVAVSGAVGDAVSGAVDGAVRGAVDGAVRGAVDGAVRGAVDGAVRGAVHGAVSDVVDVAVSDVVDDAVGDAVSGAVHVAVGDAVSGAVGDAVSGGWNYYNGGSLWPSWCAWRLFFIDECGLELDPKIADLAEAWRNLSTGAGWWWPHRRFCIVAPRHDSIALDDQGRLHSASGPALLYPDGWGLWMWHGTRVPCEWIEHPQDIDPRSALDHENVEQRRCAAEIMGWDRVLAQLQPTVIDEDRDPMVGTLLRVDLPDAPAQQFLKVLCGTGRTFVLPCVHNEFKTALEANAASWGEDGVDPELIRSRQWRT